MKLCRLHCLQKLNILQMFSDLNSILRDKLVFNSFALFLDKLTVLLSKPKVDLRLRMIDIVFEIAYKLNGLIFEMIL